MRTFSELELSSNLLRSLDSMGFIAPTPVQAEAIEPMLQKKDLLVQAPTGSGKTCAFGIPAITGIDTKNRAIQAVVLCPTRELAIQTALVLKKLSMNHPQVKTLALYGGESIQRQFVGLRRNPQIIVATPGRLMDHIKRKTVRLNQVNLVVLDEADRMLDMGFRGDIDSILQSVPVERQTVLFSATLSREIQAIAEEYQHDVQRVLVEQKTKTVENVQQFFTEIPGKTKTTTLIHLLNEKKQNLTLVFVATKAMAILLAKQLAENNFASAALHGDLRQRERDQVMAAYRNHKIDVLIATDVVARGIDIKNIDLVINYDIPSDSDSYVHRIGRTGRANEKGVAYTLISSKERGLLKNIARITQAKILPFSINGISSDHLFGTNKNQGTKNAARSAMRESKPMRSRYPKRASQAKNA